MNLKTWMPLVLAVGLGLVALVLAKKMLKPHGPAPVQADTTSVVVAKGDIPAGRELTPEDLTVAQMPNALAPTQAFQRVADVAGREVTTSIVKGQPIVEPVLGRIGEKGLQAHITPGMRAMTVSIDDITGVAGMITPGAHVDVMAIVNNEKTHLQAARTVLQDLRVLAIGRNLGAGNAAPEGQPQQSTGPSNNVTFLVTPEQARILQLAASVARPWMVLRSGPDHGEVATDKTDLAELRGEKDDGQGALTSINALSEPAATTQPVVAAAPAAAPEVKTRTVEVYRNGVRTVVTFNLPPEQGRQRAPQAPGPSRT